MSRFEDGFSEILHARANEADGAATPSPEFLAQITRRRARNAGAVVASLLLIVAGAFAAAGAVRSDRDEVIGPDPSPTPEVPAAASYKMLDVYGVDRQSAFVLTRGLCNAEGCLPGLLFTSDAGRTWIRRATPPGVRTEEGSKAFVGGFFASADRGWLFGREATYETTNGGLSWRVQRALRGVETIERGSDALWATTTSCGGGTCRSFALRSLDQGETWERTEVRGFEIGRILAINNSAAWIVQDGVEGEDFSLRTTTDGGHTWVPHPTPPSRCDRTHVAFGTTTTLVVVCGGEPATATQDKTVWALVKDETDQVVWDLMSPRYAGAVIPPAGHISRMYSAPGEALWLWLDRAGLYFSHGNGIGWGRQLSGDAGPDLLGASFPVPGAGWVALADNTLWRSSSGEIKGWEQISFPRTPKAELEAMPICTPDPHPSNNRAPTEEELSHPAVCRVDPKSVTSVPCGGIGEPPCPKPAPLRPR